MGALLVDDEGHIAIALSNSTFFFNLLLFMGTVPIYGLPYQFGPIHK